MKTLMVTVVYSKYTSLMAEKNTPLNKTVVENANELLIKSLKDKQLVLGFFFLSTVNPQTL